MRAVLSLGTNQGDRHALMQAALDAFAADTVAASPIYSTPPWGVEDQDDFLNAVIIVDVDETPQELLHRAQQLENKAQRRRERRWGPRTLDIDIVALFDDDGHELDVTDVDLTVPHVWAHQRAFVLVPWLAADPQAVLHGKPVTEFLAALDADEVAAVKVVAD